MNKAGPWSVCPVSNPDPNNTIGLFRKLSCHGAMKRDSLFVVDPLQSPLLFVMDHNICSFIVQNTAPSVATLLYTVKPVNYDHPRDWQNVVLIFRWSQLSVLIQCRTHYMGLKLCVLNFQVVSFVRWSQGQVRLYSVCSILLQQAVSTQVWSSGG